MFDFVGDLIDEIVNEYREKIRQAVKKAEPIARQKIEDNVIPKAVSQYYSEYWPEHYWRQYQLYKSLGPYSQFTEAGNVFSIKLGVEDESPYGSSAMSHKGKNVDDAKIFDNFLSGRHPNVPTLRENLQGTNTVEYVNKLLDELIENELIPIIDSAI